MEKSTTKIIIETSLKTLYFVIIGIFFSIASLTVLAPKAMINFCDALNLQKSKEYMYERVYDRTQQIEDLYNVIEVNISGKHYDHVTKYIKIMQKRLDYDEFCSKIDETNAQTVNKMFYVYVCDYDAYLRTQNVVALYNSNRVQRAEEIAFDELVGNSNPFAWEFGAFVDCVMTDTTLTASQKKTMLAEIYETTLNGVGVQEFINNNLDMVDDLESAEGRDKLKTLHILMKIKSTNKYLAEAVNDTTLAELLQKDLDNYKAEYDKTLIDLN